MFDHLHYVPVIRAKSAEFFALESLSDARRERLTPLVVVPRRGRDWDADDETEEDELPPYKKTLAEHLDDTAERLAAVWPAGDSLLVDLSQIDGEAIGGTGDHPVIHFFSRLRTSGLAAIPVTSPGRTESYQTAVQSVVAEDERGMAIWLHRDQLEGSRSTYMAVGELCGRTGLEKEEVDLVLDLGEATGRSREDLQRASIQYLNELPAPDSWRSLTLAGTSFPMNLTEFEKNSILKLPRHEWLAWIELTKADIPRVPAFGDYTVAPRLEPLDINPRRLTIAPRIRYALEKMWLLFRGSGTEGNEQRKEFARELLDRREYMGADHCAGDQMIKERADVETGPGNPTNWLQADLTHHLAVVVDQISSRRGS